jgi:hypothetical protein
MANGGSLARNERNLKTKRFSPRGIAFNYRSLSKRDHILHLQVSIAFGYQVYGLTLTAA